MWLSVLLCLLASLAGGAPAHATTAPKASVPESKVQEWTRTWQHRLHLDEWTIETRVVRQCDLKPDTLGNLKWNLTNHTAIIRVLSPLDYDMATGEVPEDMEYTVLHELIHLQLAVLPRDPGAKATEEQVVNRMADALMMLDKGPQFRARSIAPSKLPSVQNGVSGDIAVRQAHTEPARTAPVAAVPVANPAP